MRLICLAAASGFMVQVSQCFGRHTGQQGIGFVLSAQYNRPSRDNASRPDLCTRQYPTTRTHPRPIPDNDILPASRPGSPRRSTDVMGARYDAAVGGDINIVSDDDVRSSSAVELSVHSNPHAFTDRDVLVVECNAVGYASRISNTYPTQP